METKQRIAELKKARNAIILAHYYTHGDVQDVADVVGDSLALAQAAADTNADVILFAGVHFMAETAKILSPAKIVLLPDLAAGCSLAESCNADDLEQFILANPGHTVVSYVNTTAAVKALTDIACTSSNALSIISSLPADEKIIFAPDRNLGNYLQSISGRENMLIWDGACHVHEDFSPSRIADLKLEFPNAKVLAHPECKQPVLMMADHIGSTSELLRFSHTDPTTEYIIVTEPGIIHKMRLDSPHKTFIPAPPLDSTCGCNDCIYMKLMSLDKIELALETMQPQIEVPEAIRCKAEKCIRKMLEYK